MSVDFSSIRKGTPLLSNLEKLLVDPRIVGIIKEQNSKFDPFRTLGIEHYELRHTTVLSWLLNPEESHGLGTAFVDAFLLELEISDEFKTDHRRLHVMAEVPLVETSPKSKNWRFGYDRAKQPDELGAIPNIDGKDASGRRRLDVLIDGGDWCIAIEAKIRAKAGDGQLSSYYSATAKHAADRPFRCFFLTLQGDSHDMWDSIVWQKHVARPLKRILLDHTFSSGQISLFLNQYVELIDRLSGDACDSLGAKIRELTRDPSMAALLINAEAEVKGLSASGAFNPIVLRNKWLLGQLFQNIRGERTRFAEWILSELEEGGSVVRGAVVSKKGWVSFLPSSWSPPLTYFNKDIIVTYHIAVKDAVPHKGPGRLGKREFRDGLYFQQDVEIKVWLHPAGPKSMQEKVYEKIRNVSPKNLKAQKKFLRSAKLFTQTFRYSICENGELKMVDPSWNKFKKSFCETAKSQWETLDPILRSVAETEEPMQAQNVLTDSSRNG